MDCPNCGLAILPGHAGCDNAGCDRFAGVRAVSKPQPRESPTPETTFAERTAPEQAARTPHQAMSPLPFRPLMRPAKIANVGYAITTALACLLLAYMCWLRQSVYKEELAARERAATSTGNPVDDVFRALQTRQRSWVDYAIDDQATLFTLVAMIIVVLVLVLVSGVSFVVWLYRARRNLDDLPGTRPQWALGWTIGVWFVSLPSACVPQRWWFVAVAVEFVGWLLAGLVIADVARNSGVGLSGLERPGNAGRVWAWWICVGLGTIAASVLSHVLDDGPPPTPFTLTSAVLGCMAAMVLAAVLGIRVVRRITEQQYAQHAAAARQVTAA